MSRKQPTDLSFTVFYIGVAYQVQDMEFITNHWFGIQVVPLFPVPFKRE